MRLIATAELMERYIEEVIWREAMSLPYLDWSGYLGEDLRVFKKYTRGEMMPAGESLSLEGVYLTGG